MTICVPIAVAFVIGIMSALARSMNGMLDMFAWFGGTAIGFLVLGTILRSVFGVIVWPEIRRINQPGAKPEMTAASNALPLAPEETPHIRFI
ncbi:hypothetical protein BAN20980_03575 [Burkholderia anthina]|uniref:Uncharacterized protein n=1 Tax=Burkholderia anthina TaxID=179879 RepID=A0A6P2GB63_9BURK|nr:hypothetical protein BAN20980_03575 [Burkholderia anthina]